MSRHDWRSNAKPRVEPPVEIPALPVHGASLHDEGAEVAPKGEPLKIEPVPDLGYWQELIGCDVWVEWRERERDWHGQRVMCVSHDPLACDEVGLVLQAIGYRDKAAGGWRSAESCKWGFAALGKIISIRPLADEEKRRPTSDRWDECCGEAEEDEPSPTATQRPSLPGDSHYSVLPIGPLEVTEKWAPHWPSPSVVYPLGEALAMIARCGTRGQAVRDLRKAAGLLTHAADFLEREP